MLWRKLIPAKKEPVNEPVPKAPELPPTPVPSAAAGTFGTPFFGCSDIHTPHFGVTHTPLDTEE